MSYTRHGDGDKPRSNAASDDPTADLPKSASECSTTRGSTRFYVGRPSLAPGRYFRLLLLGYFEGLDSERAIAWRAADSLSIRTFLDFAL